MVCRVDHQESFIFAITLTGLQHLKTFDLIYENKVTEMHEARASRAANLRLIHQVGHRELLFFTIAFTGSKHLQTFDLILKIKSLKGTRHALLVLQA